MAEARCSSSDTGGVVGSGGIVGLLARFLHVDSSHSGLITANSRGLAGAGSVQEGVIISERRSGAAQWPLHSDWSPVEMTLAGE